VHVAQFTGGHATHCARSYDIQLCDVRAVHVAKPDDVQMTLSSVAKTDGVNRTLILSRNSIPSTRHTVHVHTTLRLVSCIGSNVVSIVHVAKRDGVHTTNCAQYVSASCVICT